MLTAPDETTRMKTVASKISSFIDRRQALVYPAPAVIALFLIVVIPIGYNLYLAFTKWTIGLGDPRFIGIDNSESMLEKCRGKIESAGVSDYTLLCQNIENTEIADADLVIMNYTLQFLDPEKRQQVLMNIHNGLRKGGIFMLSEKIRADEEHIHGLLTELYYDFKRRNGYSELEIAQKREALENVLRPITPEQQLEAMREAGFTKVDMIFRWYNFASYIGIR